MDNRKRFSAMLTVGLLLVITPFVLKFVLPSDYEPVPHTAEYFPVFDADTGKWGFIDNTGKAVTPFVFDWAGDFRQGLGLAESNGAMGYIDASFEQTGEWAITPRFELAHDNDMPASGFYDGLALARGDDGKWGYIDTAGKWAISPRFIENEDYAGTPAGDFSEGLAWFHDVRMAERYTLDENGDIVRNAEGEPIMEDYPRRLMGFIDREGEVVIDPRFEVVQDFGQGLAAVWVRSDALWGFVDRSGRRVIGPKYEGAGRFSEGLCAVRSNGLWGYIDKEGEWVIEPTYTEAKQFLEGLAPVRQGEKWGYITPDGGWAITPRYDNFQAYGHPGDARPFENGMARVTFENQAIYIDKQGKQVWPGE